jgi:hypothetical protein
MFQATYAKLAAAALIASLCGACSNPQVLFDYAITKLEGQTDTKYPNPPPYAIRALHNRAPAIIDMHADTLVLHPEQAFLERLLNNPMHKGQVDVPRLIEGNVALQVFAAYSKGSLDLLGDTAPNLTGSYTNPAGETFSRFDYMRDPDVSEYDDPNDPYDADYSEIGMPRDLATYAFRISRETAEDDIDGGDAALDYCQIWYDIQPWDTTLWGETPICTSFDLDRMYLERLLDVARRLDRAVAVSSRLRKVTTRRELDQLLLDRSTNPNLVGGLLSTEGLYFRSDATTIAGRQSINSAFDELYVAGFRMFALTHFLDNDHGGSSTGMGKATLGEGGRGLSEAGRIIVERILGTQAVIDVAHASITTTSDILALAMEARRPVVYSHGGLQNAPQTESDACSNSRNLTDALMVDIAATGGVSRSFCIAPTGTLR